MTTPEKRQAEALAWAKTQIITPTNFADGAINALIMAYAKVGKKLSRAKAQAIIEAHEDEW